MTAFANILVASKLEVGAPRDETRGIPCPVLALSAFDTVPTKMLQVAEDMLLHPPKTLDEAHLLSCTLALDWGENDAIDVQPDTEAVLLGV